MARLTPDQAAAKWSQRAGAAGADYTRGVQSVTVAPGQAAARAVDTWQAKVIASREKWQRRVASVTLADWQQAASQKGAARFTEGVQQAQPKMQQFMNELLPHIDRGLPQIKSMPNATLEQSIARMSAWARHMSGFRRGGSS